MATRNPSRRSKASSKPKADSPSVEQDFSESSLMQDSAESGRNQLAEPQFDQLSELLLQSLEHEKGGVKIYETALKCAVMPELAEEWQKYLEQTRMHVRVLTEVVTQFELDPNRATPGCQVVRHTGNALVQAMELALRNGPREASQLVACECIVLAETKDHLNWELIGRVASSLDAEKAELLNNAYEQIEDEEDEHLYHSRGWCRELWLKSLDLDAVLPPPEERKHVTTALEAAKVERASLESR
jgi:hypothetical protein